jgi:hypothetical protein
MAGTGRPRGARAEGWSKEKLLEELEADEEVSVSELCRKFAAGETKPKSLLVEVERWRASDADFRARYDALLSLRSPGTVNNGGPSKEDQDPEAFADWRLKFCTDLAESGSRLDAANKSPYSYTHIYQMLTEGYPFFDKDFAEMVHMVEMQIAAEMEGGFVWAFRQCTDPAKKAWIADRWLTKRDPRRWGKQVEITHSGKVEHEHTHKLLPREERLALLMQEQQTFFGGVEQRALPPGVDESRVLDLGSSRADPEVIDAEYVEEDDERSAEAV